MTEPSEFTAWAPAHHLLLNETIPVVDVHLKARWGPAPSFASPTTTLPSSLTALA